MQKKERIANLPFWLLAAITVAFLFLPQVLAPGMHSDGVAYATISRNLAEGNGSFWSPFFTATLFPQFYEHPPLVFGIQGLFFRILGDHLFVEKIYTCFCLVISAWLLIEIWTLCTGHKASAWIFLMLWLAIPEVPYAYANNYLENTMGIFCFGACYLILRYLLKGGSGKWLLILSGSFVFFGFLSKGPFALFPFALPFMFWLAFQKPGIRKTLVTTFIVVGAFVICFLAILCIPAARHNISTYFSSQVAASIAGKRSLPGNHFFLLNTLIYKLKPVYLSVPPLFLLLFFLLKKQSVRLQFRMALFFFLMALCVNLPVLISPKQLEQYILCAYAFYALAAAALVYPYLQWMIRRYIKPGQLIFKIANLLLVCVLAATAFFAVRNAPSRAIDPDVYNDVKGLNNYLVKGSTVRVCDGIDNEWPLTAMLFRQNHLSITHQNATSPYLITSGGCISNPPKGFVKVFSGIRYALFQEMSMK